MRSWCATFFWLAACAGGQAGGEAPPPQIQMTEGNTEAATSRDDTSESGVASFDVTTNDPSFTTGAMETDSLTTSSGATESDSGGAMACVDASNCQSAIVLGTVSGDQSSPVLSESGTDPTWVAFRVTENNEDVTGESVSFTVTLTSPAGYDFDLYAFRGMEGGMTGCGGVEDESTGVGVLDIVSMNWGEGTFADGDDESSWVAVQVDSKSGMCDPTAQWTLAVEGDT